VQVGIGEYLKNERHYLDLPEFFTEKRDHFRKGLESTRFELLPCAGTYFQSARYNKITNEKDSDFALRLTREFGVAVIPVSVFYSKGTDHQVLRFCFAKTQQTLDNAVERLIKV
jgi:methionine aminotransferase